jgi:hypothetical protein
LDLNQFIEVKKTQNQFIEVKKTHRNFFFFLQEKISQKDSVNSNLESEREDVKPEVKIEEVNFSTFISKQVFLFLVFQDW